MNEYHEGDTAAHKQVRAVEDLKAFSTMTVRKDRLRNSGFNSWIQTMNLLKLSDKDKGQLLQYKPQYS